MKSRNILQCGHELEEVPQTKDHLANVIAIEKDISLALKLVHQAQNRSMHSIFEDKYSLPRPVYIGWFWNNDEQSFLHKIARECLYEIISVPDIQRQFSEVIGTEIFNELDRLWIKQIKRLHVTAKYYGNHNMSPSGDTDEECHKNTLNKLYTSSEVLVNGFLLTSRTFSGSVKLPERDYLMFGFKDSSNERIPHVTLAVAPNSKPVQSGPDQVTIHRLINAGEHPKNLYEIPHGTLQDWGQCYFYLVLKTPISYTTLLSPEF